MPDMRQKYPIAAKNAVGKTPVETLRRKGVKTTYNGIGQYQKAPKHSQTAFSCHYMQALPFRANGRPHRPTRYNCHADYRNGCGYSVAFNIVVDQIMHFAKVQFLSLCLSFFGCGQRPHHAVCYLKNKSGSISLSGADNDRLIFVLRCAY